MINFPLITSITFFFAFIYMLARRLIIIASLVYNQHMVLIDLFFVIMPGISTLLIWVIVQRDINFAAARATLIHGKKAFDDNPDDKSKDKTLLKKIKDFWDNNKKAIFTGIAVGSGIALFFYFKTYYSGGDSANNSLAMNEPDSPPSPTTLKRRKAYARIETTVQLKDTLRVDFDRLEAMLNDPMYWEFATYIIAIATICQFIPHQNYVFYHLKETLGPIGLNSATRTHFQRIIECIERPEYISELAMITVLNKPSLGDDIMLNYQNLIFNSWLCKASGKSAEELIALDEEQFAAVIRATLMRFHSNPAVHAALMQLSKLLKQCKPFCHFWD